MATARRVGLVGAGYICEYHVAALRRVPGAEIVGLFDLDAARAAEAGRRLGIAARSSLAALRGAGAEVIHVLTPPHTHARVALEAVDLGCHVLVEKPLATDVADCRRIEEAARAKGLEVCVCHSLLYDPQVRLALNAVRRGQLGRVVSMDILRGSSYPPYGGGPLPPQYRSAGYPFRDLGVHALYLFQAFLGPIERVEADWKSLGGDTNLAYDEWRALVRCRDGLGQFQLSWNAKPMQSQIIIHGTKGVRRVDLFLMFQALRAATPLPKPAERVWNAMTDSVQPLLDVPRSVAAFARGKVRPYHGLQDLVAAFYTALDAGAPAPVSVAEATPVVDWTERIACAADRDHEARRARFPLSATVPVLVTGAGGALGSAVVERLRARGQRVRIFLRRFPAEALPDTEVVVGDLGDPEAVRRAVRGSRVVIHAGAAMTGGWTEHQCATVVGTENVVAACLEHGVDKLVHISSMSVLDWAGAADGAPLSEATPLEPRAEERGAYTRAKLEAERIVSRAVAERNLPVVILRPGQIFGGRIPLVTPAVARRVAGRWLELGDGRLVLPLVYMDDVIDAVLAATDGGLRGGEVIQIVDGEELTQEDVLRLAHGEAVRAIRAPRAVVFMAGGLSQALLGALGKKSPLSVYRLKSALARRRFESHHAGPLLGWKPRVGVREGIRRILSQDRPGA